MNFPRILEQISENNWAITPDAFNGILAGIDGALSISDYEKFHKLDEEVKATTLKDLGSKIGGTFYSRIKGNVGSLFIDGPIIPRATGFSSISGVTSIDVLSDEFSKLEANEKINKILVIIDSPGGSVKGASDFVKLISASEKRVEAINLGMMTSLAYWIASGTAKITSVDTGLIGSIGTIMSMPNPDDKTTLIISSQSPNKEMDVKTKQGKADRQRIVDDLAAIMIKSVAKNRGIKERVVLSQYGKGSVFVAQDALVRGMIDEISSLKEFMKVTNSSNEDTYIKASVETSKKPIEKENKQKENVKMETLKEAIAESSAIGKEVDDLKAKAFEAGKAELQKNIDAVVPYLTNADYHPAVKELACKVLSGESNLPALQGAVVAIDAISAQKVVEKAAKDTEEAGETNSKLTEGGNEEGIINSEADFDAAIKTQLAMV